MGNCVSEVQSQSEGRGETNGILEKKSQNPNQADPNMERVSSSQVTSPENDDNIKFEDLKDKSDLETFGTPEQVKSRPHITFGRSEHDPLEIARHKPKKESISSEFVFPMRLQSNNSSFQKDNKGSGVSLQRSNQNRVNPKQTQTKPSKPADKLQRDVHEQGQVVINHREPELAEDYDENEEFPYKHFEENPYYRDIANFIPAEIFQNKEQNMVVFEGPLLKYKPGSNFCWIERWCVLTKKHFLYYKNQWSAYCWDMKPLLILSLNDIHTVLKVSLKLPEVGKKKPQMSSDKKTYNELFQFEIFNELTDYPYDQEVIGLNARGEYESGATPKFQVEELTGYNLWSQYEQEKRKKDFEVGRAKKGHLMRPPKEKPNVKPLSSPRERTSSDRNSHSRNNSTSKYHFIKDLSSSSPLKNQEKQKVNYNWIKQRADLTSWSNREKEWYYSEKRLLFATGAEKERERWISVINFMLQEVHEE